MTLASIFLGPRLGTYKVFKLEIVILRSLSDNAKYGLDSYESSDILPSNVGLTYCIVTASVIDGRSYHSVQLLANHIGAFVPRLDR